MIFNNEQIQEILSLVDFRFADLVWKIFGPSHLTSQDKENLKKHGIDPGSLVKKIPPYWANWMFGLLSGKLSDYQTKQISYKDLLDYLARRQYETPSKREIEEYEMACNRTYGYLKGLGDKMKKDISSYISDSELRMRMEQERTIKEGVKRGIVERDTTKLIAAKISNQLNDWSRDWNRIVETEYQGVFNMGRVQSYMREGDGPNTLIYFDVYPAACFPTNDTEFLTDEGFKLLKDIRGDEKVASFNIETNTLEYTEIESKIQYWYEGEMNEYKHHSLDMICTPNHKQLIGIDYHPKEGVYTKNQLIDSSEVPSLTKRAYMYYTVDNWTGSESEEIEIAGKIFNTNSFVRMMGWYLSEGSLILRKKDKNGHYNSTQLCISQSKNKNFSEIEDCLSKTFQTNVYYSAYKEFGGRFTILLDKSYDSFVQWLKSLGDRAYTKTIPKEIKLLSKKYLFEFLLSYWKGDGFGGGETFMDGNRHIVTSSKQMADDLSEIILKCGYRPSLKIVDKRGVTTFSKKRNRSFTTRRLIYKVSILVGKHFNSIHKHFSVIDNWKGEVGCLQLKKNSTLYIRRNGQSIWSGNCRHCIRLYLTAGIGSEPKLFTAEELIGNGTNIGRRVADWKPTIITAVHPFCYDDKVEVLTNKGWKFFKDLDKTELFLSINPETGEGEYVPAVAWINQYYEGDMVYRKSKCFDLANTPNHVHVGRKHGQKHISLVNESDIKDNFSFLSHIPSWKGIDTPFIVIDNKKYDTNLFCEFLGYYLSEGSFTEWGDKNRTIPRRRVNISQKKSEAKEKIIKCCRALFKNVIVTKERIEFNLNKENDKDLIHIIRSFGHAHEKYVPDFIKELSPKYIKIFLDAFLLGDGTVHRGVLYDGYQCKPQRIYSTSSVKLKDDLGELLLKVGKCPSFKNRGKSIYHCKKQKKDYLARYDQWNVAELNSKYRYGKVMKKEIKPYKGFIYDVELEKNHTLVVRRNDNVCVSGNCRCLARRYMKGDVWDKETRSFKQPIDYKRKTAPGAKVKIIVGDKVFYT